MKLSEITLNILSVKWSVLLLDGGPIIMQSELRLHILNLSGITLISIRNAKHTTELENIGYCYDCVDNLGTIVRLLVLNYLN